MVISENFFEFDAELNGLGKIAPKAIKIWARDNEVDQISISFVSKGAYFARLPFSRASAMGFRVRSLSTPTELRSNIHRLREVMSTSWDLTKPFLESPSRDVFLSGMASETLRRIFHKRGWSSHVWSSELVEFSSFRAAVGLALIVYGIYLNRATKARDLSLAVSMGVDAGMLLALDQEMRQSVSARKTQEILKDLPERISSARGREAVLKKLASDPKQVEKSFVKECWVSWAEGKSTYKSKAAFARDMLAKCEHLTSQKKIEDWCRKWSEEIVTLPAQ